MKQQQFRHRYTYVCILVYLPHIRVYVRMCTLLIPPLELLPQSLVVQSDTDHFPTFGAINNLRHMAAESVYTLFAVLTPTKANIISHLLVP